MVHHTTTDIATETAAPCQLPYYHIVNTSTNERYVSAHIDYQGALAAAEHYHAELDAHVRIFATLLTPEELIGEETARFLIYARVGDGYAEQPEECCFTLREAQLRRDIFAGYRDGAVGIFYYAPYHVEMISVMHTWDSHSDHSINAAHFPDQGELDERYKTEQTEQTYEAYEAQELSEGRTPVCPSIYDEVKELQAEYMQPKWQQVEITDEPAEYLANVSKPTMPPSGERVVERVHIAEWDEQQQIFVAVPQTPAMAHAVTADSSLASAVFLSAVLFAIAFMFAIYVAENLERILHPHLN